VPISFLKNVVHRGVSQYVISSKVSLAIGFADV